MKVCHRHLFTHYYTEDNLLYKVLKTPIVIQGKEDTYNILGTLPFITEELMQNCSTLDVVSLITWTYQGKKQSQFFICYFCTGYCSFTLQNYWNLYSIASLEKEIL